jgi:GT2 family glycosyltransferase
MTSLSKVWPLCSYGIDQPGPLSAKGGWLRLSGWTACRPKQDLLIRLRLDPAPIYPCRSGLERPDIAAQLTGECPAVPSGFSLETHLSAGFHIGTLEYYEADENAWIPFHALSIYAELSALCAQLDRIRPPETPGGTSRLSGWCFHPQFEIESLAIQSGPYRSALQNHGKRPELADEFPSYPGALYSGFSGLLQLWPGQETVILSAKLANGSLVRTTLAANGDAPDQTPGDNKDRAAKIVFPDVAEPEVSIIIPIFNQLELTLACLESLVRHAGPPRFEVIVIDDHSDALVAETLNLVQGLRVYSNATNRGFVLNCNRGAALARGRYVLFLNNDTEVQAEWLEALLETFALHPDAGLVGAKLLYPDGRLQEAGGIMWADGSAWNYGHKDDPTKPEYNYVRPTDYCSGACIILPRELFARLGGFDERFVPAYCEDSDLAFQVRAAGYQVYYQPRAAIIHHEGKSNGTDTAGAGIKRHQVTNGAKLLEKWRTVLAAEHRPNAVDVFRARERSLNRKVILVIDHYLPHYDKDAGSRTIWSYLDFFLDEGFSIKFIGDNFHPHEPYLTEMQQKGIEVLHGSWYGLHWERWLEKVGSQIDYVLLSRAHILARYLGPLRTTTKAKLLFYGHDLTSRTAEREFALTGNPSSLETANKWRQMEEGVFQHVDVTYYPSDDEILYLKNRYPSLVARALPPYVFKEPAKEDYATTLDRRRGLLFVGGFRHPPNIDAMLWFVGKVWPEIHGRFPNLNLTIAGSNPPPEILQLASDRITITGYVSDEKLTELYATHLLAVVPLRLGGGIKGKIIESLWHGLPVLTTPVGAEGIPEGASCMQISSLEEFAANLTELLNTPDKLRGLSAGGRAVISRHYSPEALRAVFGQDIDFR